MTDGTEPSSPGMWLEVTDKVPDPPGYLVLQGGITLQPGKYPREFFWNWQELEDTPEFKRYLEEGMIKELY